MQGKELKKRIKSVSTQALADYLGVWVATILGRYQRDKIPHRHKRKIIEFFEWVNEDNIHFCDKLLQKSSK